MNEAKRLSCIVCGGDHKPRADSCDSAGMDRQIEKLGARRWNALTAHVSRVNNKVEPGPMVPWELKCQQEVCTAPECDCPPAALNPPTQSHLAGKAELRDSAVCFVF